MTVALLAVAPAAGFDPAGILVQYGAIGVFLLITLGVVRVLFLREVDAHTRERERADRLEAELRAQNQALVEKILPVLSAATHAMSEILDRDRERR